MPEVLIDVQGLAVQRADAPILHGVNWQVKAGEHWVLMGGNGSGKTSLLNALLSYLVPSAGTIRICGRTYGESEWQQTRRLVGLVSNSLTRQVDPGQSASEVLWSGFGSLINAWQTPPEDVTAKATALLHQAGLSHLSKRPWRVLSQGERQRILLLRALMDSPRILFLDEPCAGLDPVARAELLEVIESLTRSLGAPAVILITHHVEEITPGFSHALLLRRGRLVAQGTIPEVLTAPHLSTTFGVPLSLHGNQGSWHLEVHRDADRHE